MNINRPAAAHTQHINPGALPIKNGNSSATPATETEKPQTVPSNPPHLGNSIDTTA